jgi:hypothetical protein
MPCCECRQIRATRACPKCGARAWANGHPRGAFRHRWRGSKRKTARPSRAADKVIVSKQDIRISGRKVALGLAATRGLPDTTDGVITFVRDWRPVGDGTSFAHKILIWNEFQTPHLVRHTRGDTSVCHKGPPPVKMGLASRSRLPVHLPARTIT